MKNQKVLLAIGSILILGACQNGNGKADAYGQLEVSVTTISAKTQGEILEFNIDEGIRLEKGVSIGLIDTSDLHLKKLEIIANQKAIESQFGNLLAEIEVLKEQLINLKREEQRVQNMLSSGAATQKQLDDIQGQKAVVEQQIKTVKARNPSILAQVKALEAREESIQKAILDAQLINPMKGVVLTKFVETHEMAAPGKPLYRIADLDTLEVRAFVPEDRLATLSIGEEVVVKVDGPDGELRDHKGILSWIAEEAEFTPKTIQTREERVNLVYAIKVLVSNDGSLKIGMPAEVWLQHSSNE